MVRLILFVLAIQPLFDAASLLDQSVLVKLLDPLMGNLTAPEV